MAAGWKAEEGFRTDALNPFTVVSEAVAITNIGSNVSSSYWDNVALT